MTPFTSSNLPGSCWSRPPCISSGAGGTPGQVTTVTGIVLAINDSVLNAWSNAGTISEGDRLAAEFATHFMDAAQVLNEAAGGAGGEG